MRQYYEIKSVGLFVLETKVVRVLGDRFNLAVGSRQLIRKDLQHNILFSGNH